MGAFRFLLAISVFLSHVVKPHVWTGFGSENAVELFFLISGFTMQKSFSHSYKSTRKFYLNRALRLYPAYLVSIALALSLLEIEKIFRGYNSVIPHSTLSSKYFIASLVPNLLIFTSDWLMFFSLNASSSLAFGHNLNYGTPLYAILWIAPVWSLGVEATYYLLVPLVSKLRKCWITISMLILLGIRAFLYLAGLNFDPWTYRFFAFELPIFLLGALAAKIESESNKNSRILGILRAKFSIKVQIGAYVALFLLIGFLNCFNFPRYLILGLLVPIVLFFLMVSRESRVSRRLGNLTFPFYLIHLPLVLFIRGMVHDTSGTLSRNPFFIILEFTLSLIAAIFIEKICRPIEKLRQAFRDPVRKSTPI
jgi:peptidoglycan/LPS O-acetylase OafA/YrhL